MTSSPAPSSRRFWIGLIALIALLTAAAFIIPTLGGTPDLRARTLTPANGSTASQTPLISVIFARPMNQDSLNGKVFLNPAAPFELGWIENELRIIPLDPLLPNTDYTVTIGPDIVDAAGTPMRGTINWTFRTRTPRLAYLVPFDEVAGELWLTNSDGTGAVRLSGEGQRVVGFGSSPDGNTIIYSVEESPTTANLWRVATTNPRPEQLTRESDTYFTDPRYSPTGDLVAVEVRRAGDDGNLIANNSSLELRRPTDGSPAGEIYDGDGVFAYDPRWSPDGSKIAFIDGNGDMVGIFNFTPDFRFYPSQQLRLLGDQPWDPSGGEVVYDALQFTQRGAERNLVIRNVAEGVESPLAYNIGDAPDPAYSPDGQLIAVSFAPAQAEGRGRGLWLVPRDGSEAFLVTATPFITNARPVWSPDGAWLAYSRFDPVAGLNAPPALWVVRPDGRDDHQVAAVGAIPVWVP